MKKYLCRLAAPLAGLRLDRDVVVGTKLISIQPPILPNSLAKFTFPFLKEPFPDV